MKKLLCAFLVAVMLLSLVACGSKPTEDSSQNSAANWVKQNAREGDLVVCMSCGDLYKACDMMVGKA